MAGKLVPLSMLLPPHKITHTEKLVELANSMEREGWKGDALVGYQWGTERIQLLTGSHRFVAALMARLKEIPVIVFPYSTIEKAWGTDSWSIIIGAGKWIHYEPPTNE